MTVTDFALQWLKRNEYVTEELRALQALERVLDETERDIDRRQAELDKERAELTEKRRKHHDWNTCFQLMLRSPLGDLMLEKLQQQTENEK